MIFIEPGPNNTYLMRGSALKLARQWDEKFVEQDVEGDKVIVGGGSVLIINKEGKAISYSRSDYLSDNTIIEISKNYIVDDGYNLILVNTTNEKDEKRVTHSHLFDSAGSGSLTLEPDQAIEISSK